MEKILKSRIQERGQITIPVEAREALHLTSGEEIVFIIQEDGLVLRPLLKNPLEKAGMLGKESGVKRVKDLRLRYHDW